jgi:anti-sigma factor RsiW
MNECTDIRARLSLYLDEELEGRERSLIETHLRGCEACSRVVNDERAFLDDIRQPQLYLASDALRARVKKVMNEAPSVALAPPSLQQRIREGLSRITTQRSRLNAGWSAAAPATVILILPLAIWLLTRHDYHAQLDRPGPSHFALMAADTHLRHTRGQLPLEIATSGPEQISKWFANKVQFSVKLPNYQDASGQEKLYKLEGARLVGYKDDYAAYVAYQMRTRPISLVITSDAIAQPAGGEEIKARGLTFHYDAIQGLKVITWSDRGLTYALVSDLDERGQESCVVCHQGAKDQDFIAPLKPR